MTRKHLVLITLVVVVLAGVGLAAGRWWPAAEAPSSAVSAETPASATARAVSGWMRPATSESPGPDVVLPLHLVAVATGAGVEPRAYIASKPCGDARGYSRGDSPLLGMQLVEIRATEVTLETPAGLRRLPMSAEKCELPAILASGAGSPRIDEARRQQEIERKQAFNAEMQRRIEEGKRRRASMTPAEISKYDLQSNPECWPDEVPAGKTELDVIPEYCY